MGAFAPLMQEASRRAGRGRHAAPERTVLTHFLALAASPGFEEQIARWGAEGVVPDDQACALERARHAAWAGLDPRRAHAAALQAVSLAREAAHEPERSWVLQACLQEASFLTASSTVALRPWLVIVADPSESSALRQALLRGMTHRFLQDPARRVELSPSLDEGEARTAARAQLEEERRRFLVILEAAELAQDLPTLAQGTAVFALELERGAAALGESFLVDVAGPGASPERQDLVDAWIEVLRAGPPVRRLESLGLWRPGVEPRGPHRWFACLDVPSPGRARAFVLGGGRPDVAEAVRRCGPSPIAGPAPLLSTLSRSVGDRRLQLDAGP